MFHENPDTAEVTMFFMDLLALRKAKLGGKCQAPEGVTERGQQEVGEEAIEGVRGDTTTSKEVMEERNKREEPKIGGNLRKNLPKKNLAFSKFSLIV